jgi:tRNA pseudouridine55 synthase
MIIPIWQKIGCSSHQLSYQLGQQLNQKATHTGTLDPLAEGVLVVLTGLDRFHKAKYSSWRKTYEFSIVCGISTDSYDKLGLIQSFVKTSNQLTPETTNQLLPSFLGKQTQQQPTASAGRSDGQSGFDLLKTGRKLDKTNQIEIFSLEYLSQERLSTAELLKVHQTTCQKVVGEFRQESIIRDWNNKLQNIAHDWLVIHLKATTSKRTYIRSLVHDIGQKIGMLTTTWSITRTANGPYTYADCVQLLQ